jgi:hypothetical protein
MKKVAILQSNYIPWKGYFDLVGMVDQFVLYDDVQFTKNDWRNRNLIKTATGLDWLTIPVGSNIKRLIRDVELPKCNWREVHLRKIRESYVESAYYNEVMELVGSVLYSSEVTTLSMLNRLLIEAICRYLSIHTVFNWSWEFNQTSGKSERLASICVQAGATHYLSGPSAKSYLDESCFAKVGVIVEYVDYLGYPEYNQVHPPFCHNVSIMDLLLSCGRSSVHFMKFPH